MPRGAHIATSLFVRRSAYASWNEGFGVDGAHELCCVKSPCRWPSRTHDESFMSRIHAPRRGMSSRAMSKLRITTGNALPHRGIEPLTSSYLSTISRVTARSGSKGAKKNAGYSPTPPKGETFPSSSRAARASSLCDSSPPPDGPRLVTPGGNGLESEPSHTTSVVRPVSGAVITSNTLQCRSYWSAWCVFFGSACVMELMGTVNGLSSAASRNVPLPTSSRRRLTLARSVTLNVYFCEDVWKGSSGRTSPGALGSPRNKQK